MKLKSPTRFIKIRLTDDSAPSLETKTLVKKRLTKLEALRGFAAFYVVLHHTLPKETFIGGREFDFYRYGQEAVMLFFIMSGFVIQYAYIRSADKSFKSFFLKRFLRIYIPLFCVFLLSYTLVTINLHHLVSIDWKTLAGNLLMLQDAPGIWHRVIVEPFLGDIPLWSLSYEWWFYMLFFVVIYKFKNKASLVVYATGITAALTYVFYPFFINRELMYLVIWWAGTDMAKLYANNQPINLRTLRIPFAALAVITLILTFNIEFYKLNHPGEALQFMSSPLVEWRHFGFTMFAIIAAMIWKKANWFGFKYTLGLFEPFAFISFAVYISHWFLVSHAKYLESVINNFYLRCLIYFLVCCLFSYIVERIIYVRTSSRIMKWFSPKQTKKTAIIRKFLKPQLLQTWGIRKTNEN